MDSSEVHLQLNSGGNSSMQVSCIPRYRTCLPLWVSVEDTGVPDWLQVVPARVRFALSPGEMETLRVACSTREEVEPGRTATVTLTLTGRLAVGSEVLRSFLDILPATARFRVIYRARAPPTVAITSPQWGTTVDHTVAITGRALRGGNGAAIKKVEIRIEDGSWRTARGTDRWSYRWDSTTLHNGNYMVMARACNGSGYSSCDAIVVKVRNPREKDTPGVGGVLAAAGIAVALLLRMKNSRS